MASGVPDPVRRFVADHIDSASLLDALLLLHAEPERWFAPGDVASALKLREPQAVAHLARLHAEGLAERRDDAYRFASSAPDRACVDQLAELYARRRTTVVALIFGGPDPAVASLADAFRFRRPRKDR